MKHACLTIAALAMAMPALAEEQVDVLGPTIFPPEISVPAGSTLRIHNRGEVAVSLHSLPETGEGSWSVGPIAPGASATIKVEPSTAPKYTVRGSSLPPAVIKVQ